jgi:hypothetical protein
MFLIKTFSFALVFDYAEASYFDMQANLLVRLVVSHNIFTHLCQQMPLALANYHKPRICTVMTLSKLRLQPRGVGYTKTLLDPTCLNICII